MKVIKYIAQFFLLYPVILFASESGYFYYGVVTEFKNKSVLILRLDGYKNSFFLELSDKFKIYKKESFSEETIKKKEQERIQEIAAINEKYQKNQDEGKTLGGAFLMPAPFFNNVMKEINQDILKDLLKDKSQQRIEIHGSVDFHKKLIMPLYIVLLFEE